MGLFSRDNGEWVEGTLASRDSAAWTDPTDAAFVDVAGEWIQFQPDGSALILAPENLATVPTSDSVDITWTDPTQVVVPTHVQVRIPEVSPVWTEYSYGTTTAGYIALDPSREYQAQVRYIVRSAIDGTVTTVSPPATEFFTTAAPDGPSVPAEDPGGSGPDSQVTWPNTNGTPGAVDSSDCWWEYVVQIPGTPVEFALTWVDTAVTAEIAGDVGTLDIDFVAAGLDCGELARWKYREVCNAVPEDWEYTQAWIIPCDWSDPCAGTPDSSAWTRAPWTDAIMAIPQPCQEDSDFKIVDHITDIEFGKLSGYLGIGKTNDDWWVKATAGADAGGSPIISGYSTGVNNLTSAIDFSVAAIVALDEQPPTPIAGGTRIAKLGDRIFVDAYASGAGYTLSVVFPDDDGGAFNLNGTTVLALEDTHVVAATCDQNGNKLLYINGVVDVTDTDTAAAGIDDINSRIEIYGNRYAQVGPVGAWDRVLSEAEVGTLAIGAVELSGPTHHWKGNEGSGATLADIGSNARTLTKGAGGILTTALGLDGESYIDYQQTTHPAGSTRDENVLADLDLAVTPTVTLFLIWKGDSANTGYETMISFGGANSGLLKWRVIFRNMASPAENLQVSTYNTGGTIKNSENYILTTEYNVNGWMAAFVELRSTTSSLLYLASDWETNKATSSTGGVGGTIRGAAIADRLSIGDNYNSGFVSPFNAPIGPVLTWDRALTPAERTAIAAEFEAQGWGTFA